MAQTQTIQDYQERIRKVVDFIDENLQNSLSLEELAAIGNFSPFHFHRIIRGYLREPLLQYVKRQRLERGASLLHMQNLEISEIAWKVGFAEASSFNKAFKKHFGVNPTQFRKDIRRLYFNNSHIQKEKSMKVIPEFKTLDEQTIIFSEQMGEYDKSAEKAWKEVCSFAGPKGLLGPKAAFLGISMDDPNVTDTAKLRYQACVTVPVETLVAGSIGKKVVAGGRYAIFTHKGSYNHFHEIYNYIFGVWMVESGEKLRDEVTFEKYINSPGEVPEDELLTEIYVPVE